MDIILLFKKDLDNYSQGSLDTLQRHFNIPRSNRQDLIWLLAIHQAQNTQVGQMRGKEEASPPPQSQEPGLDMSQFNKVLGAGGFGVIIKKKGTNTVGKFLHNATKCDEAKVEYQKHLAAYVAFQEAQAKTTDYPRLCVSQPIDFKSIPATVMGRDYKCYYLMTELHPLDENGLYHIISQQPLYESLFNKKVGQSYKEPVSDENPSRGFFATYNYLEQNVLKAGDFDIPTLIRYMGYAFGVLLFIADLYPRDIEYVLGRNEKKEICFTILDFGLADYVNYEDNEDTLATIANKIVGELLEIDIYFPITEDLIKTFKEGFTDAYNLATPSKSKNIVYTLVMEEWVE